MDRNSTLPALRRFSRRARTGFAPCRAASCDATCPSSRSVRKPRWSQLKQDFAKWESLKKNLLTALEQTESQLSEQLRARENRERLNAGRHDAVTDTYRDLVDRYYQSLAVPRKSSR